MKEELINKIDQLGGMSSKFDILVSIDDFFEANDICGSFAANACDTNLDVKEFYSIFKMIEAMDKVQEVWIMITDIDEEWPYSDTALIALSSEISNEEVNKWFGDGFPNEIQVLDIEKEKTICIPNLKEGYKLLYLWWD